MGKQAALNWIAVMASSAASSSKAFVVFCSTYTDMKLQGISTKRETAGDCRRRVEIERQNLKFLNFRV